MLGGFKGGESKKQAFLLGTYDNLGGKVEQRRLGMDFKKKDEI